jgi:hypothetical protein
VAQAEKPDESKQETKTADSSVAQPLVAPPRQPPATADAGGTSNPNPPKPILVQLVGGDDLEPFEVQTLAIARETLVISKRTYWITIFGFFAALAAACFVGVQVAEMTDQTQILASQAEGAHAGALMDEMNTRRQLAVIEKQADASQRQATIATRTYEASQRPYIGVEEISHDDDRPNKTMTINVFIKNFGANPGENVEIHSHWYINNVETRRTAGPPHARNGVLFPGKTRAIVGKFSNVDFSEVDSGKSKWTVRIFSMYQ